MQHASDPAGWMVTVSMLSNLMIVGGYFAVPATTLPRLIPWNSPCPSDQRFYRTVRVSGVMFFGTCGIHHLHSAFTVEHAVHVALVINEMVQAVAVWAFIVGFNAVVRRAARRIADGEHGREVTR